MGRLVALLAAVGLMSETALAQDAPRWVAVPSADSARQGPAPDWLARIEDELAGHDSIDVLIEFKTGDVTALGSIERGDSPTAAARSAADYAASVKQNVESAGRPLAAELSAQGIEIIQAYAYQPILHARITAKHLALLAARTDLIAVYPNERSRLNAVDEPAPDRPQLFTTTVDSGAAAVWAQGFRGQGYTIAILDNGIVANHEMFKDGKIVAEACFSNGNSTDESLCAGGAKSASGAGAASVCAGGTGVCDHGSHVAGIAAGNNKAATSPKQGVAPDARLIAIQVFTRVNSSSACDGTAPCLLTYASDQIAALDWLIANGPAQNLIAVNMSLGGSTSNSTYCDASTGRTSGVNTLRVMGILTAIAAGNEGFVGGVTVPGCIKAAVTVSGTNTSHTGANSSFNHAPIVDLLAPGTTVQSAVVNATNPTTTYGFKSGSSMATPHIAGAIALLKSRTPSASAEQIEYALKAGGISTTLSNWSWSTPRMKVDASIPFLTQTPPPTGVALIGYQPGAVTSGFSYIRVYNPNSYASTLNVSVVQDLPKKILGIYRTNVPGRAALQIQMKDIEAAVGQAGAANSTVSLYADANFIGFAQNIQWNATGQSLTNLTTCRTTVTDPNTFLGNVHTSLIQGYPSYIRIHNSSAAAAAPVFDLYNSVTGGLIGSIGTTSIEPNTTITLSGQGALDAVGFNPGTSVFHVNFVLRSGFTGVIAHIVDNTGSGVLTDMTPKCPI
ncbi:MAG: S8 family serine peptidase [Rhodospirillaceae bacterium]|nr:S8 family serine peptidase [Rhodospirillaceae bacterium]